MGAGTYYNLAVKAIERTTHVIHSWETVTTDSACAAAEIWVMYISRRVRSVMDYV